MCIVDHLFPAWGHLLSICKGTKINRTGKKNDYLGLEGDREGSEGVAIAETKLADEALLAGVAL